MSTDARETSSNTLANSFQTEDVRKNRSPLVPT